MKVESFVENLVHKTIPDETQVLADFATAAGKQAAGPPVVNSLTRYLEELRDLLKRHHWGILGRRLRISEAVCDFPRREF